VNSTTLIRQLRDILQLTQTEAQIARQRVAQARTDAVRRELRQNAENAERRADKITRELRALGGVPDVITPALGRLTAVVKGVAEQGESLDEALLGDLDLEQRLLGRVRYLKALADGATDTSVRRLAEELETAHSATVEWLSTVLAEEALGGPAALRATPIQRATGGITRLANIPARYARDGVNRAIGNVWGFQTRFGDVTSRVARFGRDARDVASTGVKASLGRAEQVSRREGADDTARRLHEARREMGALNERELPIPDYDELNQQDAINRIKELDRPADVRAVLNYEEAHKDRSSVVSAAQIRLAGIAKETTGIGSR
jgi:bacterioferritin (cytochrome b1)